MKYLIICIGLLFGQILSAQNHPQTLPEFSIFSLDGKEFTEKNIIKDCYSYIIYFNPTCSHCQVAFENLNSIADQLRNADVILYPVSANTKDKTVEFFDEYAPEIKDLDNMVILRDDNYKLADILFVGGFPESFLYDKNNKFVKVYKGEVDIIEFLEELK